jgi:hypothetical protein
MSLVSKQEAPKKRLVSKQEAPKKLKLELVRPVAGETDPVVIKTKTIKKTDEVIFFSRMKPMPRAYFVNAIIKRTHQKPKFLFLVIPHGEKTVTEYVVRFNAYWAEALESLTNTLPKFSQELENLKLSDDVQQHINSVAASQKFVFDSTMIKLMLVVFAMAIPFGFLMDSILNIVPHQIVTWFP